MDGYEAESNFIPGEVELKLEDMDDHSKLVTRFLIFTGMRMKELAGLSFKDIQSVKFRF